MINDGERLTELLSKLKKLNKLLFLELIKFYNFDFNNNNNNNNDDKENDYYDNELDGDFSKVKLNSFKISNLFINNPIISAPMAGISDNTYRIFAKHLGCSLTYSEMVTSYGLIYKHKKSFEIVKLTNYERPCAIQIFGNDANVVAEAAQLIEENADVIDINMGCPVPKVLKTKSGGYLLNEPETIRKIIKKVKENIKKPLTVKLRIGWDNNNINIIEIAKIAENEGVDAIAIHGRTVKQGYSGTANYEYIKKVKSIVKIPVIASGDINNLAKARWVMNFTGCDGLMIGRAARGNPWIFIQLLLGLFILNNRINNRNFKTNENIKLNENDNINANDNNLLNLNFQISNGLKIDYMLLYLKFLIYFKGEEKAVKEFRKILGWAFKGQRDISAIKNEFFKINTFEDAQEILKNMKI